MRNVEVYIEGSRLELFDAQSINITEVIQDIKDISNVFSDYTQQFKVPASDVNNRIFKHYYNFEIDNGFDARFRRNSIIKIDGSDFKTGRMRLDGVIMRNNKPYAYKVVFFGSGAKLKDILGDLRLSDLNYLNRYNHIYDEDTVRSGMEVGLGYNILTEEVEESNLRDIVYPLVSNKEYLFYDSSGSNDVPVTEDSPSINIYRGSGLQYPDNGFSYTYFKPSIRLIRIVEAIEAKFNGLRFSRDFFGKSPFNELFMHLHRDQGNAKPPQEDKKRIYTQSDFNITDVFVAEKESEGRANFYYRVSFNVVPAPSNDGEYSIRVIDLKTGDTLGSVNVDGGERTLNVKLEAELGGTREFDLSFVVESSNDDFNSFTPSVTVYTIDAYYDDCPGVTEDTCYFEDVDESNYSLALQTFVPEIIITDQVPEMSCIDFLTSIFKMFNLTAFFDDETGKIVVQTLKDYYLSGNTIDISDYIVSDESEISKASLYSKLNFQYEEPQTFAIVNQNTLLDDSFGDLDFETSNLTDPDTGNRVYFDGKPYDVKAKFEHLLFERLSDENDLSVLTNIQTGWLVDEDESPTKTKPIIHFSVPVTGGNVGSVGFAGASKPNISSYFRASNVSANRNFTINFGSEMDEFNLQDGENNNSLFRKFYDYYISDLFKKKTRIFEFEAKVPNSFILNHQLNDLFVINNRGFRADTIKTNLINGKTKFKLINIDFLPDNIPFQPENLVLVSSTLNSATIEWDVVVSNSNISYNVYLDEVFVDSVAQTFDGTGTAITPTITLNNLINNQLYNVRVSAVNEETEGLKSSPLYFNLSSLDVTPPSVPTGFSIVEKTVNQVSIDWNDSTDDVQVLGYNIYLDGVYIDNSSTSDYVFTGLDNEVDYIVNVSAYDLSGNTSALSSDFTISLEGEADTIPPTRPKNINVINKDRTSFEIEWDASVDNVAVDYYNIYIDGVLDGTSTTTKYLKTGLQTSTTYFVTIEAVDTSGNISDLSSAKSISISAGRNAYTIKTTSKSSTFQFNNVSTSSTNPRYRYALNGVLYTKFGANPVFDFSSNEGEVTIIGYDADLLTSLTANGLDIISVDIFDATSLDTIDLFDNNINYIDLSNNGLLTSVDVSDNSLVEMNVANGNNASITTFDSRNNPNLICIQVDDETNVPVSWQKDGQSVFSNSCPLAFTLIPDTNFEQELIDQGIDLNPTIDGGVLTSAIENLTSLFIGFSVNINSLTGLQDFSSMTTFSVFNVANFYDFSQNSGITNLTLRGYNVGSFDFSVFTALNVLDFQSTDNSFTSIDLSSQTGITSISFPFFKGTSVDLSLNTALQTVRFANSSLTSLNLTNLTSLVTLQTEGSSSLSSLTLPNTNTVLSLQLKDIQVATVGTSNFTNLTTIDVRDSIVSSLDITNNSLLDNVQIKGSNIDDIGTDSLLNQLSLFSVSNGFFRYDTRTSASDVAVTTLQARGWTITTAS